MKSSSDRTFGLVFAAFFAVVALLPLWSGRGPRVWAAVLSGLFLLAGLAAPKILAPLNRAWTLLGGLLHKVTSPIILGILSTSYLHHSAGCCAGWARIFCA